MPEKRLPEENKTRAIHRQVPRKQTAITVGRAAGYRQSSERTISRLALHSLNRIFRSRSMRRGEWERLWESAAKQGSSVETLAKYAGLRARSILDDEAGWERPLPGRIER